MTQLHLRNIEFLVDTLTGLDDPAINDKVIRLLYECATDLISITDPQVGLYNRRSIPRLHQEYASQPLDQAYDTDSEEVRNPSPPTGK